MMPTRSPLSYLTHLIHLPRLTLTARLTALYTLVSSTVLLDLGWLTILAVQSHFDQLDQCALR